MPAYRDKRDGRWRYRKWVTLPNGTRNRIAGTPATDTKVAAEAAERAHIDRVLHPERVNATAEVVPERKEKTIREHAETFLATYKPHSKPSEKRTKRWVLEARLLPYFGDMAISQLDQPTLDGFIAAELNGRSVKTVNNRLAVLSTLIKYVTGDKPRLRFKIAGMPGEMSAVPMEDVEKLLAVASPRDRAVVLLAAEAGLRAGEIATTMRYVDVIEDDKREAIAAVFGAPGQQVGNKTRRQGRRRRFPSTNSSDPNGT